MHVARRRLEVKVIDQGRVRVEVSKDGNTVGLTSIIDQRQFVL